MRITAADLLKLGVVDRIVAEPIGGAHRAPAKAIATLGAALGEELDRLATLDTAAIRRDRRAKYLAVG